MSRRRWLALAIAGVAFFLLAGRLIAALWVDRAWYAALGADSLWRTMVAHTLAARAGAWILATAFVYANIYGVRRSVVSVVAALSLWALHTRARQRDACAATSAGRVQRTVQ